MDTLIIGAGGHGKVVLDILRAAGLHRPVGFIDADPSLAGTTIGGLPVLGAPNLLPKLRQQKIRGAIVAIGDNAVRASYAARLLEHGFELINAIHPAAVVSSSATVGRNVVIAAGAVVCAEATLADSVIVNTSATIDHECQVAAGSHICPMAALAGRVRVEAGAFVGMGAKVIQCRTIGMRAIVGAGAVVISDVPAGATVVGVPARVIKTIATTGFAA
ncbi:MAG TPA: acetyltransferase [Tepidisphaeraceae bacterium]|jgi:UDP-perosamine 4-acetyltransferase|nr:acetyltransferase [Tepidisphaeraceae bacterium]